MAKDGLNSLDCGGENSCGGNCDDCPFAAIVGDLEEEVNSLLKSETTEGLGSRVVMI